MILLNQEMVRSDTEQILFHSGTFFNNEIISIFGIDKLL
jgi:hypothetical protein